MDSLIGNAGQGLGAWPTLLALGGAVLLGALGLLAVLWEAFWPDARARRWQGLQDAGGRSRLADALAGDAVAGAALTDADAGLSARGAQGPGQGLGRWLGQWLHHWLRSRPRLQALGQAWARGFQRWWPRLAPGLQRVLGALGLPEAQLRQQLQQAGWDRPHAALLYRLSAAAGLLGGPLLLMGLTGAWRAAPGPGSGAIPGALPDTLLSAGQGLQGAALTPWLWLWLLAAWAGLRLPDAVLAWRRRQRQRLIFNALPGALDLMRVCVQAGLGLDAAMDRVGRELRWSCPPLSQELALLGLQLRAGAARNAALRQMAARIGLPEFDSLVGVLVQSERFGTPVGQALQTQATLLRERRRQRAEAAAARLPVHLVLPLVLCVLPALLVVLLGPAVLGVLHNLLPGLSAR